MANVDGGIEWELTSSMLRISPTYNPQAGYERGEMKDYDFDEPPWGMIKTEGTMLTILHEVTNIGNRAFHDCTGFYDVAIPNSVNTIGQAAFAGCTGFEHPLRIPASVKAIDENAFLECPNIEEIRFEGRECEIDYYAFVLNVKEPKKTYDVYSPGNWAQGKLEESAFTGFEYHDSGPTTKNTAWVKINGAWKKGTIWKNDNGVWKHGEPRIKQNGWWK